jgi:hypothetical protein
VNNFLFGKVLNLLKLIASIFNGTGMPTVTRNFSSCFCNLYNQFYDNLSSYGSSNYFGVLMEQEIFSGGKTFLKMSQNDLSIKKAYNKFNKSVNDTIYSAIESYQNIILYRKKIKLKEENFLLHKYSKII